MHIFLDESGDLGYKDLEDSRKSPYFVICGICTQNAKGIAKAVVKTRQTLNKPVAELKFSKSTSVIKRRLLEKLATLDLSAYVIVVNKRTVFPTLMDKKEIYFNWVAGYLIYGLMLKFPEERNLTLIVDRRSFHDNRKEFDKYINYKLKAVIRRPLNVFIKHEDSQKELCLQASDFIAGAVHRRYRYNDEKFFEIIKHKMDIQELHKPILNTRK